MSGKFKAFCNRCNKKTFHSLICEHNVDEYFEILEDGYLKKSHIGNCHYQIIECNGCESISFRRIHHLYNYISDFNEKTGESKLRTKTFVTYYPERFEGTLTEKKIQGLPKLLQKAYREVIESYNNDLLILCSGGLRVIVESICNHYSINAKNLRTRIEMLSKNGHINMELAETLKIHKFLGDRALHRIEIPTKLELESAIHLIESTLEILFDVPFKHQKLKEIVTNRVSETEEKNCNR